MDKQTHIFIDGFWDRLDDEISKQNKTKTSLAKECGFDRKNLMRVAGHNNISLPYFARVCHALNVSADYLLFGETQEGREV